MNCRFDRAGCQDWRLWDTELTECTFVGANLEQFLVGAFYEGRPNRLSKIDFTRANLAGSGYWGVADVVDCDFSESTLKGINFFQASLIRCTFAGVVKDVIFDGRVLKPDKKGFGNPMEDIDMSGVTSFENVDFRGVRFDRVHLPDDPNLVVVRDPDWADRALARIESRTDLAAEIVRGQLEYGKKYDQPTGAHSFVNLGRIANDEARALMAHLVGDSDA